MQSEYSRRQWIAGGLGMAPAVLHAKPHHRRPNFVFVLCDDLGYTDAGCYGNREIHTPNIDRFASEGLRLTNCYAASPVCSPSRAGFLTGRTPNRTGLYNWVPMQPSPVHLPASEITFARLLRDAGYKTCLAGKWHLNGLLPAAPGQPGPTEHGFDHWFAANAWTAPSQANPENFVRNGQPCGRLQGYASTLTIDESLRWLSTVKDGDPFCLFVSFHAPHEPIASSPRFRQMYNATQPPGRAEYYANVSELDHEFGRLLDAIDRRGARGNTFVVFTSDNGPETLNRHQDASRSYGSAGKLRSRKLSLYEGGIRIPGILRYPGRIKPRRVSHEPVSSVDLLPTVCDLAGLRRPAAVIDGASLVPLFQGRALARSTPLHWHYYNAQDGPTAALRDGDWKLLGLPAKPCPREPGGFMGREDLPYVFDSGLVRFELYNLARDPAETTDLGPREPARLQAMVAKLSALHAEVVRNAPHWEL